MLQAIKQGNIESLQNLTDKTRLYTVEVLLRDKATGQITKDGMPYDKPIIGYPRQVFVDIVAAPKMTLASSEDEIEM